MLEQWLLREIDAAVHPQIEGSVNDVRAARISTADAAIPQLVDRTAAHLVEHAHLAVHDARPPLSLPRLCVISGNQVVASVPLRMRSCTAPSNWARCGTVQLQLVDPSRLVEVERGAWADSGPP